MPGSNAVSPPPPPPPKPRAQQPSVRLQEAHSHGWEGVSARVCSLSLSVPERTGSRVDALHVLMKVPSRTSSCRMA
jgi:hypothetical protein